MSPDPLESLIVDAIMDYPGLAGPSYDSATAAAPRVGAALRARFGAEHHVTVDATGWRLEHPIDCRMAYDHLDCPTHQALSISDQPFVLFEANGPGTYRATMVGGFLEVLPQ